MTVASNVDELRNVPVLEGVRESPKIAVPPASSKVEFISDRDEQVGMRANVKQSGYLVLDDSYYPGWEATIDGHSAMIVPANENFRAIAVTPGVHLIDFRYRPTSFRIGAILSVLTLIAVFVGLCTIGLARQRGMRNRL